jgi:hypothetical protein
VPSYDVSILGDVGRSGVEAPAGAVVAESLPPVADLIGRRSCSRPRPLRHMIRAKNLCSLIWKKSPSRLAVVGIPAASDPPSGSVSANAALSSPRAIPGK